MIDNEVIDLGPRKKGAKSLARKLIKDAKITEVPVSLQKIIEYLQKDYDLEVRRTAFANEVSGLLVKCSDVDKEYFTIGFNSEHPWCRRRFTIAHEIGHLLFGHLCEGSGSKSNNEKESDVFAAELLVPTAFLKKDFVKTPNIPELSKLYRVSGQMMAIRIGDARLLKI